MDQSKHNEIITIPNLLSGIRILLAIAFYVMYRENNNLTGYIISCFILALSGLTDILDGRIARKYNMISELGKILDPIADKFTQGTIMICLLDRYPLMLTELILFLGKEIFMIVIGPIKIRYAGQNEGALWFGKMNTVILYIMSVILILLPEGRNNIANSIIVVCCITIVMTLLFYALTYFKIIITKRKNKGSF